MATINDTESNFIKGFKVEQPGDTDHEQKAVAVRMRRSSLRTLQTPSQMNMAIFFPLTTDVLLTLTFGDSWLHKIKKKKKKCVVSSQKSHLLATSITC